MLARSMSRAQAPSPGHTPFTLGMFSPMPAEAPASAPPTLAPFHPLATPAARSTPPAVGSASAARAAIAALARSRATPPASTPVAAAAAVLAETPLPVPLPVDVAPLTPLASGGHVLPLAVEEAGLVEASAAAAPVAHAPPAVVVSPRPVEVAAALPVEAPVDADAPPPPSPAALSPRPDDVVPMVSDPPSPSPLQDALPSPHRSPRPIDALPDIPPPTLDVSPEHSPRSAEAAPASLSASVPPLSTSALSPRPAGAAAASPHRTRVSPLRSSLGEGVLDFDAASSVSAGGSMSARGHHSIDAPLVLSSRRAGIESAPTVSRSSAAAELQPASPRQELPQRSPRQQHPVSPRQSLPVEASGHSSLAVTAPSAGPVSPRSGDVMRLLQRSAQSFDQLDI
jgi:hypothetical protein